MGIEIADEEIIAAVREPGIQMFVFLLLGKKMFPAAADDADPVRLDALSFGELFLRSLCKGNDSIRGMALDEDFEKEPPAVEQPGAADFFQVFRGQFKSILIPAQGNGVMTFRAFFFRT